MASFSVSAFVTWLSIVYARRRNLVDHPGQRRSHTRPTPRGGGIGIVAAVLIFFCVPLGLRSPAHAMLGIAVTAMPLLLVAAVGWIDDHRPLSSAVRLLVHLGAALTPFILTMLWARDDAALNGASILRGLPFICIAALLIVWSINLHNFMDGINGLLAAQSLFVFVVLGGLCFRTPNYAQPIYVLAAATLGFLPFNFPRARVFMGDVGSGSLGLLIACAVAMAVFAGAELWPQRPATLSGVIACSAFVTDATCNLLSRMLRGKRWYSAHREHLYQWMVRAGMSHRRVVAWYMGWNLFVVLPVLFLLNRQPEVGFDHGTGIFVDDTELAAAICLYAFGIALWIFGKRWCLHKVKSRRHHAAA